RRVQPHLCRRHLDADPAGLDWRACANVPFLWFGATTADTGQSQERDQQAVVLRSRNKSQLRQDGRALQCRGGASTATEAEGQGCGGGRGALCAVLYPWSLA